MSEDSGGLKRALGPVALTFYGLGGILGAGIYALVGKIAGTAGNLAWAAFLVSFLVAGLTGLTYCELGARYPRSAAESVYVDKAFGRRWLTYAVGFFVCLTGIISTAALSHAFAGYLSVFWPQIAGPWAILFFMIVLALITYWGIREASWFNIVCTVIETGGIGIVIWAGFRFIGSVNYFEIPAQTAGEALPGLFILQGAMLAFYAFVGFEDIVNVADETKDPARTIPVAVIASLVIAAVLYILTALIAVSVLPLNELEASKAPLLEVVARAHPEVSGALFTAIALFAITNSTLINFIMSSRLLYGMAREGWIPAVFAKTDPRRRTPHAAIFFLFVVSLALAFTGSLEILAEATSFLLMVVFALINAALIRIKRTLQPASGAMSVPAFIPYLGLATSIALMFFVRLEALGAVVFVLAAGAALFALQKKYR